MIVAVTAWKPECSKTASTAAASASAGDSASAVPLEIACTTAAVRERCVESAVQRTEARLKRARKTASGVPVVDDARAAHVEPREEAFRVRAENEHDVFEARRVRGIDNVLDERSTVERREELLSAETPRLAGGEDHAADLRGVVLRGW